MLSKKKATLLAIDCILSGLESAYYRAEDHDLTNEEHKQVLDTIRDITYVFEGRLVAKQTKLGGNE